MFERQREREKKRNFPFADSFPNACAGWGQAETRSFELGLSPLCGRKGASDLRQQPGLPGALCQAVAVRSSAGAGILGLWCERQASQMSTTHQMPIL